MKSIDQGNDGSIVGWRDLPEHSRMHDTVGVPTIVNNTPRTSDIAPLTKASGFFAAKLLGHTSNNQAQNAARIASSSIQAVLDGRIQEQNEEIVYAIWIEGFRAACRSEGILNTLLPNFYSGLQNKQRELVAWVYVLANTCKNINHLPEDIPGLEAALRELDALPEPDHLSQILSTLEEEVIEMLLYLAKLDIAKIR